MSAAQAALIFTVAVPLHRHIFNRLFLGPQKIFITNEWVVRCFFYRNTSIRTFRKTPVHTAEVAELRISVMMGWRMPFYAAERVLPFLWMGHSATRGVPSAPHDIHLQQQSDIF